MKIRTALFTLNSLVSLGINLLSATEANFLRDDFVDGRIDNTVWVARTPFSGSAAVESNGVLNMTGRGGLLAIPEFSLPVEIRGSVRISSLDEIFRVVTRTRGTQGNPSGEYDDGYAFTFSNHDTPYVRASIERIVPPTVITIQTQSPTAIIEGEYFEFRITDDGTNMALYVGDLKSPLISYSTTESFGNRIGFYNRESGRHSELDWIQITDTCGLSRRTQNKATILKDEFFGPLICPSVWRIHNVSDASSVVVTDGKAVLDSFGSLETVESLPDAIDIRARFRFAGGSVDHFKIGIRTDLALPTATDYTGVFVGFDKEHNTIGVAEAGVEWLAVSNFIFDLNADYDFRITDDGKTIIVYLNDLVNPLIKVQSTHRTGNNMFLHNREIGGSKVEIDFVEVKALAAMSIYTAIEVEFETEIGRRYQIQISEDMNNWTNFELPIEGNGSFFKRLYSVRGSNRKFHRVQLID